jgi:glyoxylase-like metal-dependent hydrolase (beta-lactamase superfamily II)
MSVWIGERCVITGDVLHHPIECRHSEWTARGDADPDAARATRRALVAAAATTNALMLGTHFHRHRRWPHSLDRPGLPLRAATPRLTFRHLQACARHRILGRTSGGNDP